MATVGLIPRVRIMVVCDRARASKVEADVFDLKGVRQTIHANAFPFAPSPLWLYLVLSSPRPGQYPGYIKVFDDFERPIYYGRLSPIPTFDQSMDRLDIDFLSFCLRIGCSFPAPGRYSMRVYFFQEQGSDVLKAEQPFYVLQEGV